MKLGLALAAFASALLVSTVSTQAKASAFAEIYSCSFTEPFVDFDYNSSNGTLSTCTPDMMVEKPNGKIECKRAVTEGVSLRVKAGNAFELVDNAGVVLYELQLTNQGSDGMSDRVYPFDGIAKSSEYMPLDYLGGCSSTSLPAKDSE